jgi:hypothetical protein
MEQLNTREALLTAVREVRQDIERIVAETDKALVEQPGSFGDWSLKDLIAHLTGWRQLAATRLEAALRGEEPVSPWPPDFKEGKSGIEKNQWLFETNRDKPLAQVLSESRETFDRVERALVEVPEDDLFLTERFPWIQGTTLSETVVQTAIRHYRVAHEPEIHAWLNQL